MLTLKNDLVFSFLLLRDMDAFLLNKKSYFIESCITESCIAESPAIQEL